MSKSVELSLVVPVFQEEEVVPKFVERVSAILEKCSPSFEIIFCLDPGKDNTQGVIEDLIRKDDRIRLLVFSRRFGQPASTIAGIESCRGEACVVIDVDLQDPPEVIPELVKKWREGFDVVYARRRKREGETLPKRVVSYLAYKFINKIADVSIPRNTGDFRLINRRVIESLRGLKETHGFLRGLVAFVGFKQAEVLYDREARVDGRSKYSQLTGSIKIGINGIVTNSTKPLTFFLLLGIFGLCLSGLALLACIALSFFELSLETKLLSFVLWAQLFIGSFVLFGVGVLGEYVGRIYDEVRMRPKYLIESEIDQKSLSRKAS